MTPILKLFDVPIIKAILEIEILTLGWQVRGIFDHNIGSMEHDVSTMLVPDIFVIVYVDLSLCTL